MFNIGVQESHLGNLSTPILIFHPIIKRLLILLFSIGCSCLAQAGKADSAGIRITYLATYRLYEGGESMTDTCILDIGKYSSHFYSKKFIRREELTDSLNAIGASAFGLHDEWVKAGVSGPCLVYEVFKHYPGKGLLTYCERIFGPYHYQEDMPQLDWQLEDGDTVIVDYPCDKASTTFRQRHWTVYYTSECALDEGPWKLCGLPGLILYAEEDGGNFSFSCIGIESASKQTVAYRHIAISTKCTPQKMQRLKITEYADRKMFELQTMGISGEMYDANGKKVVEVPKKACLMEVYE